MSLHASVKRTFAERFGGEPSWIVRAPGRVNLIGEHTDYNEGFVLPMAIDRAAWIALGPSGDRRVTIHSVDFAETRAFDLDALHNEKAGWIEYMKGVAWALLEDGFELSGFNGVAAGDVPVGAGLSSSAALELATARAFAALGDLPWDAGRMALLGQKAENHWVGVKCGIMDQLISAAGRAGHALLIDCRDLKRRAVPLPEGSAVVVLDTATRRGLESSAYNQRRAQCEAAARFFGVPFLRDVSVEQFEARAAELDELPRQRARHIVTENQRTLDAADALERGDAEEVGSLMSASHVSLRDDFEVSSPELNAMVEAAHREPGCFGARMTGAGFGGCAVALIEAGAAEPFVARVGQTYNRTTGLEPSIYVCQATEGAAVVP